MKGYKDIMRGNKALSGTLFSKKVELHALVVF